VERLQKFLAAAGIASRRKCEELVGQGRVTVNEQVATLGATVDPQRDRIAVDGVPVSRPKRHTYLLLNKPAGYVTTAKDEWGRSTVLDLVRDVPERVFPVRRLDKDTEGLLLLTNDGELAHRLTHPRYELEKEYLALVRGRPPEGALERLRRGVEIEGRLTAPAKVELVREEKGLSWLRITLHEGRKRQVRLMCRAVGHPVERLIRVRLGPLTLGDLRPGEHRRLTPREAERLKSEAFRTP